MATSLYRYDPLDRLAHTRQAQDVAHYFYQADRRFNEVAGKWQRTFLHSGQQWLAIHERLAKSARNVLVAGDQQDSVLAALGPEPRLDLAYSPYGHGAQTGPLPGFNGEFPDSLTGHYLLGNGYRAFNPVLGRFNSPDSLSPFAEGGVNAYAYCQGDPVNRRDPSGHFDFFGDFWREVMPILGALVPMVTTGVLYKFTKPRIKNVLAGKGTRSDKTVVAGGVGVAVSAAVGVAGVVVRYVEPQSNVGHALGSLALLGAGVFSGVRYAGLKIGKVKPAVTVPVASNATRQSSVGVSVSPEANRLTAARVRGNTEGLI